MHEKSSFVIQPPADTLEQLAVVAHVFEHLHGHHPVKAPVNAKVVHVGRDNLQIVQPVLFINSLVGTMGNITTEDIETYLKRVIVSRLNDYLGEELDTILNLPGQFDEMSVELQQRLTLDFAHFGLRLSHLYITSITPPEEVQKAIDDRSRMSVIKDMEKFVKLKAASAMEKAAENQSEAGAGMGMGIGMMMPAMFAAGGVNTAMSSKKQADDASTVVCPDCRNTISADARFCPACGHQQLVL